VIAVPAPAFTVTTMELDPLNECLVFLDSQTPRPVPRNPWVAAPDRQ
jgi:hypothetical protein